MTSIKAPGLPLKRVISMIPLLIVLVTREPRATAPINSVQAARKPTCTMVRVRAATEVAYELATSLAPLPNAEQQKKMVIRAKIQSYLCRVGIAGGVLRKFHSRLRVF